MTIEAFPPEWATSDNYSAGPDTGTPTKVDPASADNGFIRGVVAAPQHINFLMHDTNAATRRLLQIGLLHLRELRQDGVSITDLGESMAAVQYDEDRPLLMAKTAQALAVSDISRFVEQGVPTDVTSLVTDLCAVQGGTHTGKLVLIGTGGTGASRSADNGGTWATHSNSLSNSAGANARIYPLTNGVQIVGRPGHAEVRAAAFQNNWGLVSVTLTGCAGIAALGSDPTDPIYLDTVSPVTFTRLAGVTSGTVDNAADFDESGTMVGNNGALIYHCGRLNGGTSIQVSASADGDAWTTLATLTPPGTATFADRPRIMICWNTGMLVIGASLSTGDMALYASVDGADWVGPSRVNPSSGTDGIALAGGRLFYTHNDMLFASDGIGVS